MSENSITYTYPEETQKKILGLVLVDPGLDLDVLRPNYFSSDIIKELICKAVLGFRQRYGTLPSQGAIGEILFEEFRPENPTDPFPEELFEFAAEMVDEILSYNYEDIDYYRDLAVDFAKRVRISLINSNLGDYISGGRYDEYARRIVEAVSVGSGSGIRTLRQREVFVWGEKMIARRASKIPTGFVQLDELLEGGMSPGELVVVMAPTNGGKTRLLLALAINAMLRGSTPYFVTVELANDKLAARVGQSLTEYNKTTMGQNLNLTMERQEIALSETQGDIRYFQFTPGVSTLDDVRKVCDRQSILDGARPPIIYVDYVDKLKPGGGKDKRYLELESQYVDLFAWASEWNIPVVTASQTNREAQDRSQISLKHLGDAYAKAAVADIVLAVCPTSIPTQFSIFLAKNRDGVARQNVNIRVDPDSQRVYEGWTL